MDDTTRQEVLGRTLVDARGDKVGTVSEVYLDDSTGAPTWLRVSVGRIGTTQSLVPVAGAQLLGDSVQVPHDADAIEAVAHFGLEAHLSNADVSRLRLHYGVPEGDQPELQDVRQSPGSVQPEPGGPTAGDGTLTASSQNPSAGEPGSAPGESSGS
jgi:sporulation protein YlmC with PRC-barrel domain